MNISEQIIKYILNQINTQAGLQVETDIWEILDEQLCDQVYIQIKKKSYA